MFIEGKGGLEILNDQKKERGIEPPLKWTKANAFDR